MKISKVDHVKSGVSEKPIEAGGMLYAYPARNSKKNLDEHVKTLNNKAKVLYTLFTPIEKGVSVEAEWNAAKDYFKKLVINNLNKGKSKEEIYETLATGTSIIKSTWFDKDQKRKIEKERKACEIGKELNSTAYGRVVDQYLRESLRRKDKETGIYTPYVIKKLLSALYSDDYTQMFSDIPKSDVIFLIDVIDRDYNKEKQLKRTVESIENNNVNVQIASDGKYLIPSSALKGKKAYVFDFMKEYASKDDAGQKEMLKHMRYLMLHYYFGEKAAKDAVDMVEWSFGTILTENDDNISNELPELISKREEEKKNGHKGIVRRLEDRIWYTCSIAAVIKYNDAISTEGLSDNDKKWIGYISDNTLKLLKKKNLTNDRIRLSYLCQKTWTEWISYIALKYIELGKGVYNFVLSEDDIDKVINGEEISLGLVNKKYRNGISSFDYERVSAEDMLSRGLARFVSFAVNSFSQSVRDTDDVKDKKEDLLTLETKNVVFRDNAKKLILRYFGGLSSFSGTVVADCETEKLFEALKGELYAARNSSFHFSPGEIKSKDNPLIKAIFDKEYETVGEIYRKMFYSNNVLNFYAQSDIDSLMNMIYSHRKENVAQVPSFNKVLSREEVKRFIPSYVSSKGQRNVADPKVVELFRSSFYFVIKEIYYYEFLGLDDLASRFKKVLKNLSKNNNGKDNNIRAYQDFIKRFYALSDSGMGFADICQEIMTEYNQQNNQKEKKPSAKAIDSTDRNGKQSIKVIEIKDDSHIYQHYRMLLYIGIRGAFEEYLNEKDEVYGFLKNPVYKEDKITEDSFVKGWKSETFNHLKDGISGNAMLSAWYVTAHFMTPKNLNHLIGLFKNYIQYVTDIERRAKATGNAYYDDYKKKVKLYSEVIDILEFAKMYCGRVSNNIEDYFDSKDDYAKYLSNFVDFKGETADMLQGFCNKVNAGYFDGMNPIPNRNIVLSSMYGNVRVLSNALKDINEDEIKEFRQTEKNIAEILKSGICKTKEDQANLRAYQNTKNRIELVDVLTFTELINDLYGQLVSYSYLRERDLMYMQLGFYYTKLFYTDSVSADDKLRKLIGESNISDGAILYQIVSLYSHDLPVILLEKDKYKFFRKKVSAGVKIGDFVGKYFDGSNEKYYNGLRFFEITKKMSNNGLRFYEIIDTKLFEDMHDYYTQLRDYIDHFKYFAKPDMSILDMYNEMFNGFFSYDTKLKKSVSYTLNNILLSYAVSATLSFEPMRNGEAYVGTKIDIAKCKSDYYTYKLKEDKANGSAQKKNKGAVKIPAKNQDFLDEVLSVLRYRK